MKKKIMLIISVLVVITIVIILLFTRKEESTDEVTYKDVKVSTTTIENTITSEGEVTSDTITLSLNTYRYFSKMYYEVGSFVKKGTKILKYTNGTYYKAPYDLVIVGYNLPDSKGRIRSNHNIQVKKMTTLKMTLNIDETEINKVSVGDTAEITLNAYTDKTYTGKITFINYIGNYSSSGTKYIAEIEFKNDGNVKLGMSGNIKIIVEKSENVISVPTEAVQTKGNKKYVVVVNDDGTTTDTYVETGISSSAYVEIKSGLSGEETIRMIETTTEKNNFGMGDMKFDEIDFDSRKDMPNERFERKN